jgi:hypothetical protein
MPEEDVEAISHAPTAVKQSTPNDPGEEDVIEEECVCWDGIPRVIISAG